MAYVAKRGGKRSPGREGERHWHKDNRERNNLSFRTSMLSICRLIISPMANVAEGERERE